MYHVMHISDFKNYPFAMVTKILMYERGILLVCWGFFVFVNKAMASVY